MQTASFDSSTRITRAPLLAIAAGIEALTGLAMLVAPLIVTRLLLGGDIPLATVGLVRLGGLGLLSLAIAAWPNADGTAQSRRPLQGLLTYNLLAMLLLLYLRLRGGWLGILLWPAVLVHAALTVLLTRMWWQPPPHAADPRGQHANHELAK